MSLVSQLEALKGEIASKTGDDVFGVTHRDKFMDMQLTIVVIGASGDLARKKTFPALFALHGMKLLPKNTIIAGYSRSSMAHDEYLSKISANFSKKYLDKKDEFLSRCFYFAGSYSDPLDFVKLDAVLNTKEAAFGSHANRIFYMAIPPSIFVDVGKAIQPAVMSKTGWNRVVVEKPFGKDSESSAALGHALSALFTENQIYRIDHYLGKEMVQNLMVLRFSNGVFEPLWNRKHIQCVTITFKEPFGTQGRGGYFDEFGIIRDILQNHLLQVLSLVAMEPPTSLSAEDVRDQKVKVLRAIKPIVVQESVLGQYGAAPDGSESSYLDDPTVPKNSVTPTFATLVLHIQNSRWAGVPFILKAGKAIGDRKTDIRIQFKQPDKLFQKCAPNELVLRVQPREAIYLKVTAKNPGLGSGTSQAEMDLSYDVSFQDAVLPDAYERLIWDCVRGDHNLFVRSDELVAAWKIFTPLLHQLERERIKPITYEYGSRGPKEADELLAANGFVTSKDYKWKLKPIKKALPPTIKQEHGETKEHLAARVEAKKVEFAEQQTKPKAEPAAEAAPAKETEASAQRAGRKAGCLIA